MTCVVLLAAVVTPAHRGGQPLLAPIIQPYLDQFGLSFLSAAHLKGENPHSTYIPATRIQPRFVVRFENNPDAERALHIFRENRGKGRQAFAEWADGSDAFRGFRLATLTPAGEAVLAYESEIEVSDPSATLKQMSSQMSAAPGVSFADPYPFYPDAEQQS